MFFNQYLVSNTDKPKYVPDHYLKKSFKGFNVFHHQNLRVYSKESNNSLVVLIGYAFDVFNPTKTIDEVTQTLARSETKDLLFQQVEKLSGRFVLIYKSDLEFIALTDFFAQRQVFYFKHEGSFYLSSSDALLLKSLNIKPKLSEFRKKLAKSKQFLYLHEHWFLGEKEWDERLRKLLPNHFLDIEVFKPQRVTLFVKTGLKKEQVLKESDEILKNTIQAVQLNFRHVYIPLTGGYDSRLIMSASLNQQKNCHFFTFNRQSNQNKKDVNVAKKVANKFRLNYQEVCLDGISENFEREFSNQFIVPRILPKLSNNQWFKENLPSSTVVLSGGGGALIRDIYNQNKFNSLDQIMKEIELDSFREFKDDLDYWLKHINNFSDKYKLKVSDLFYLEMRIGKWGGLSYVETDYAGIERFSPFNNKHFVYSILLNINQGKGDKMDNNFVIELMENLLPESSKIEFNPKSWKDIAKSFLFYKYYKQQLRNLIYKIKKE